ncbi:MAG: TetR/AcrR family transcriptional regulator [Thermoleophilia bacterium]
MSVETLNRAAASRRGRPARLSSDQIVEAALVLADAEGLPAVSMRRLARELDVSPMALYGYFEAKRDLVRGMLDVVSQGLEPPASDDDAEWPDLLTGVGRRMRETILLHPGLAQLFVTTPALGGRAMQVVEAMIGRLRGQGLPPDTAVRAVYAVTTYAIGFVAQEVPRMQRDTLETRQAALESLPEERFPNIVELAEVAAGYASDEQFEAGLIALVDGFRSAVE